MESHVQEKGQTDHGIVAEEPKTALKESETEGGKVKFDIEKCNACGDCLEVCPRDALSIYHKDFVIQEKCNGCGKCVEVCDKNALQFDGTEK